MRGMERVRRAEHLSRSLFGRALFGLPFYAQKSGRDLRWRYQILSAAQIRVGRVVHRRRNRPERPVLPGSRPRRRWHPHRLPARIAEDFRRPSCPLDGAAPRLAARAGTGLRPGAPGARSDRRPSPVLSALSALPVTRADRSEGRPRIRGPGRADQHHPCGVAAGDFPVDCAVSMDVATTRTSSREPTSKRPGDGGSPGGWPPREITSEHRKNGRNTAPVEPDQRVGTPGLSRAVNEGGTAVPRLLAGTSSLGRIAEDREGRT